MRVVLIMICSLCCNVCLYSQSTYNPPDVIPRSPEASNLGRYGEIQVGEYTGTPDISIPLHTITSGKIKYPLVLLYKSPLYFSSLYRENQFLSSLVDHSLVTKDCKKYGVCG